MELAHMNGEIGVLLGLEGHSLGSSLAVLRMTYSLGARFISLTKADCSTPWVPALNTKETLFDEGHPNTLTNFGQVIIGVISREIGL
jgi:membrane dipeptidase